MGIIHEVTTFLAAMKLVWMLFCYEVSHNSMEVKDVITYFLSKEVGNGIFLRIRPNTAHSSP